MSETNFLALFGVAVILNVGVTVKSTGLWETIAVKLGLKTPAAIAATTEADNESTAELDKKHLALLKKYLVVYLLATMSDWLQGPYVYALYSDYGYQQHEIAILFVAGFGSSMVFGSFIGGMADWGGRRTFVVLYSVLYFLSCVTKHFNSFGVLMLGRLLGGVATSLLFSVFDAWLIRAHNDAKLKQYLGKSFSWAAYGNSTIAILAGLIANNAASAFKMNQVFPGTDLYYGGYLNPFDIAIVALLLCGGAALTLWEENYGQEQTDDTNTDEEQNKGNNGKWYDGLHQAFGMVTRNTEILLCGIISSLFEGSMYIFVFMWTPALTGGDHDVKLPFGLIFSTFMVCCMAGSSTFSLFMERNIKVETLAIGIFGLASGSLLIVAMSPSPTLAFVSMNLFEIAVGLYWPTMGTMKGAIVPESKRAAIYNLFRIPLNFIVLFSLLTDLTPTTSFTLCGFMLACATGLQYLLAQKRLVGGGTTGSTATNDEEELKVKLTSEVGGPKDDSPA